MASSNFPFLKFVALKKGALRYLEYITKGHIATHTILF